MEAWVPNIQWFPGHMAKTRRIMRENMRHVDVVIELLDARIPYSSSNPEIEKLVGNKPRVVLLNKSDMADPQMTARWVSWYKNKEVAVLAVDCRSGKGLAGFESAVRSAVAPLLERRALRGMTGHPLRMMIVGVPNVGKSSLINRLAKGKRAKVEDRPGVTRGKQWVGTDMGMELLDMPGVLWPKFEEKTVAQNLAFTGAVKDDVLDIEGVSAGLAALLNRDYAQLMQTRYRYTAEQSQGLDGYHLLELIGKKRGMLLPGGVVDTERAAIVLLDEFRSAAIGRISLEQPSRR